MNNRRVESFLLRLVVHDSKVPSANAWHGRIQHISSGGERRFESMQDLIDFIGEQLGQQQPLLIVSDDHMSAE